MMHSSSNLDVWQVSPSHVDVHLHSIDDLAGSLLDDPSLKYTDIQIPYAEIPDPVHAGSWNLSSLSNTTFHEAYHNIEDIGIFVKQLLDLYPENVELVPLGHSAEHREMFALEIFKEKSIRKENSAAKRKNGFLITEWAASANLQQWIATSTAMFVAHALLADTSESYSLSPLLNNYDFYIILLPNPDGYVYTWETDRLWYKNRQIVGFNEKCVGIDLNRNWGHKWKPTAKFPTVSQTDVHVNATAVPGTDPCTHWYPGHRPFEAPEVNNLANYVTTLPNLRAYLDLRSYGQMISTPFSYSCKKTPKDAENQVEAALGAARAIKVAHGVSYMVGTLCHQLYKAPGNVVDYMYAKAGIKFSYAVHLRDTGTYGFLLPPEWIRPVGEETANMIKSIVTFISNGKFLLTLSCVPHHLGVAVYRFGTQAQAPAWSSWSRWVFVEESTFSSIYI
ncbi:hypothetical protein NM688_g9429 [Phlebia brevispora]|uniref:Uncharacterized protein n=1 Tax=Phlebia brevispora TaxID=194682 RepID=A0ACC1RHP1_9APHY|nr:hypothetical protein NM688_g9429 [Phlebia brevispora]